MSDGTAKLIGAIVIVIALIAWFVIGWLYPIIPWIIIALCVICWAFGG